MNDTLASASWSTASCGRTPGISPTELSALGAHLRLCVDQHDRLFALQGAARTIGGFLASRFVTLISTVALLIGIGMMVLR